MKRLIISLAVALMMVAVMAVPVMAAETGDTSVEGTLGAVLEVTVPASITFATFEVGEMTAASEADALKITCNNPSGWDLKVKSNNENGKMKGDSTAIELGAVLLVSAGDLTDVTVTTAEQVVQTSPVPGEWSGQISLKQTVAVTDPADTYRITLTFTGYAK